jgi:hypothetical protein
MPAAQSLELPSSSKEKDKDRESKSVEDSLYFWYPIAN